MKILKKLIFSLSFVLLNISIVLAQEQIICGTSTVNSTTNSIDCKKAFKDNLISVVEGEIPLLEDKIFIAR
jgi:hypothetical protein